MGNFLHAVIKIKTKKKKKKKKGKRKKKKEKEKVNSSEFLSFFPVHNHL
jgi:hypothetical protein